MPHTPAEVERGQRLGDARLPDAAIADVLGLSLDAVAGRCLGWTTRVARVAPRELGRAPRRVALSDAWLEVAIVSTLRLWTWDSGRTAHLRTGERCGAGPASSEAPPAWEHA